MSNLSERVATLSGEKRARLMRQVRNKAQRTSSKIPIPKTSADTYPLSFSQERIWLEQKCYPDNPFYNEAIAVLLSGPLRIDLLEQSFNKMVERHEMLRTTFNEQGSHITQRSGYPQPLRLFQVDLRNISEHLRENEVQRLIKSETKKPFKLDQNQMFRVSLLQINDDRFVLIFVAHHSIFDGWSGNILGREIFLTYAGLVSGNPSRLPDLPIKYMDYVIWQRERQQAQQYTDQLSYWKQRLADSVLVLELPTDWPRGKVRGTRGARHPFTVSQAVVHALKQLAQQNGATLFMVLLAAFKILLHRYTGQADIIVGAPVAGRNTHQIENLIGVFINTLALRTDFSGNPSFNGLLKQVRSTTLGAYANQDLPFEQLVSALALRRDPSRTPLFQVMFGLESKLDLPEQVKNIRVSPLKLNTGTAKVDLSLAMAESESGFNATLEYDIDLFDESRMKRLSGHFQALLASIVANPGQRVSELSLLSHQERHQLLGEWNNTQQKFSGSHCVHQLFERQVEQSPDSVALTFSASQAINFPTQQLTYGELNRRANQLAHYVQSLSPSAGGLVGICLERSVDWIIAVLAVLKAGQAYLPLDPTYPRQRLSSMVADARPDLVITTQRGKNLFPEFAGRVLFLDEDEERIAQQSGSNPACRISAEHLAYVIYTSGSTGQPKGVLLGHRGLCNIVEAHRTMYGVGPSSRFLQFASFSFDGSVYEIFMALTAGARLCMASQEVLQPGPNLLQFMQKQAISHAVLPPAVLRLLPPADLLDLQVLLSTGDACLSPLVERWSRRCRFVNGYGPTEGTIGAAMHECVSTDSAPPIGRPFANVELHILDDYLQPVPVGITGQLYIGGEGLAHGYLNRPDLTAENFIPHPFSQRAGTRLYKTGDLARYHPDGAIQWIGRVDRQVKVRGFRIELGEVEALVKSHSAVREAIVIAQRTKSGNSRLVGYVLCNPEEAIPSSDQLRDFTRDKIPDYMVPAAFMLMDAFPLTASGKVDYEALPKPDLIGNATHQAVTPRNAVEEILAKLWTQCLEISDLGIDDDFFQVGGHSLLITQMLMQVKEIFRIDLPLRTFIEAPTIKRLAEALVQHEHQRGHVERLAELYKEISLMSDEQAQEALAAIN